MQRLFGIGALRRHRRTRVRPGRDTLFNAGVTSPICSYDCPSSHCASSARRDFGIGGCDTARRGGSRPNSARLKCQVARYQRRVSASIGTLSGWKRQAQWVSRHPLRQPRGRDAQKPGNTVDGLVIAAEHRTDQRSPALNVRLPDQLHFKYLISNPGVSGASDP